MRTSIAAALALIAGVSLRAKLEERFLKRDLGDEVYGSYRRRVPMFVPSLKARAGAQPEGRVFGKPTLPPRGETTSRT